MRTIGIGIGVVALVLTGCAKKPSAGDVCSKLEAAQVATGCKADAPAGLGAAAKERVVFDLPSVPGKTGQVLTFDTTENFDATVKAFDAAAVLAGRHRYNNPKKLVFVQLNSETPDATGLAAKAIVDGL
jgi:hypothetical protein